MLAFLKGRIDGSLAILDKRLAKAPFVLGDGPTIADISLCAYLYYPAEEFGFDIAAEHKNIAAWLDRIKSLPGWAHPYDLMPGYPPAAIAGIRAEYREFSVATQAPVSARAAGGETGLTIGAADT